VLEPGAFARVRLVVPSAGTAGGAGSPAGDESPAGAGKAEALPATASAVRIPAAALVRRGGLVGVYLIRDGVAILRWIRAGAEDGDHIQVLAGLQPGDVIALEPARLADGRTVEVAP
jgi:hypothetical protein